MEKKSKSFWGGLWTSLISYFKNLMTIDSLIKFLQEKTIKLVLKKLLLVGGFKAWLVTYIIKNFYKELGGPLIAAGLIEIGYIKDEIIGEITSKKIIKARREQNANDYHDAVDDVFND